MLELHAIKADPIRLLNGSWWKVWPSAVSVIDGQAVRERPPESEAAMLIVPIGTAYERAIEDARKPYIDEIRERKASDETLRKIQSVAMARSVLMGWQALTMGGELVPYSEAKAIELLSDPAWSWMHDFVLRAAQYRAATLEHHEARDSGN